MLLWLQVIPGMVAAILQPQGERAKAPTQYGKDGEQMIPLCHCPIPGTNYL